MAATAMTEEIMSIHQEIGELKKRQADMLRDAASMTVQNYELHDTDGAPVKLSELFGAKRDMILVHNMGKSCAYCTLWADGFNGLAAHLQDRASFVLSSPDEPKVLREFGASRGWSFPLVSTQGASLAADLGFEPEPGKCMPGASMLRLEDDGSIRRHGMTMFGPGDDYCSVWPLFDLLALGANGWSPKFSY